MTIALTLLGCEPPTTLLTGAVYTSHDPLSDGLAGAEVAFVDEFGERLAGATTDGDGAFEVAVPSSESLFAVIRAEGYATSTFPGTIGIEARAEVADHALYGVSLEERERVLAMFAGCPGGAPDGPLVFGEIREYGIADPYTGESPTTSLGTADLQTGEALTEGCYLDDEGGAFDPEADFTGASGQFAVFPGEAGLHDLVIRTLVGPDEYTVDVYPVWIEDEPAVVSPWWPAWASFPIPL
ncbi:MAG: hypothetical protein ABMA64_10200 [Myxococcota bacterium]